MSDDHDGGYGTSHILLEKFDENGELYETIERDGNLFMIGGISGLLELMIGKTFTTWSNANAFIGVGDSTTANVNTMTDLQATTNKLRKAMVDTTYPSHTDGTGTVANTQVAFRASFGPTEANFVWNEWGVFNASTAGRMFNRKVESLGTKAVNTTWQFTVTVSIA